MKIAVAQVNCSLGDVTSNCKQITSFAKRARGLGADVVIFPEMIDTGYEMLTVVKNASKWDGLPFVTAKQAAADLGLYVICGLSEREEGNIYNSLGVFEPAGDLIGKYRKTHLFSGSPVHEQRYLTQGNSLTVVRVGDMTFGLLICYDLRFPEISRMLVLNGAEVLVVCSAWPFPRDAHWKTLLAARAIENQVYVVAANRIGSDGPLTFCGSSCIVDPLGVTLTGGSHDSEELLISEISPEVVVSVRGSAPVLQDRRKDLYVL